MVICKHCGAENPASGKRCAVCGAALDQEESKPVLLGSMGGRRYSPEERKESSPPPAGETKEPAPEETPAEEPIPEEAPAEESPAEEAIASGEEEAPASGEEGASASEEEEAPAPTEEEMPAPETVSGGLLGSMGGKRYLRKEPEAPAEKKEPEKKAPEKRTGTGLAGSMGGVRYEGGAEEPEDLGAPAGTEKPRTQPPADPKSSGVAGSMGGVRYGTKPKDSDSPAMREEGVAGSMGGVRYGIKPEEPPAAPEEPTEKKKGPDKGLILAAAVTVVALAAVVLLVFWNAIFGSAEIYGMGLGGFVNYYKPVEEEDILEEEGVKYVGDQMVIISALNTPYEDMERFLAGRDMRIIGYVELIDTYQVQLDQGYTLSELHSMAKELEKDPLVDSATVNAVHENSGFSFPSDPWDGACNWGEPAWNTGNWGVMAIRAPQSWQRWEPAEVRAGVVDSVFDENQPDLNFAMTKDNEIFDYVSDEDNRAHGTHVSGTIGAIHDNGYGVAGVAENCRIYGYSTLRYEGVIEEVSAIAELAAQDVHVINYSMGLIPEIRDQAMARNGMERDIYYHYASLFSQTAMEHLLDKGYDFVLVCAAGNDPVEAQWASEYAYITEPAVRDRILVVGAAGINRDGSYFQTDWSGLGGRVDVLGPGLDILSTYPDNRLGYMSGTSMATPHVTGVCASVWALNPGLTGAQVKQIVLQTANIPVPGGDANMVNMEAAMEAAERAR